ncbi:hypothetical protein [Actinomadura rugatobispora]|uniref:Uncharacterized protein n=1 Tax=Actinomadura rugatobispora TaxID=1994 RepID=A0ABW0ZR04_9ACTN|nr:hypothetical protein GCM10010200_097190 [Actinomadura rugatobispora]
MKLTSYRALLTLDSSASPVSGMPTATRSGVIRIPETDSEAVCHFHATITATDDEPLTPGERLRDVTVSVTEESAPDHLTAGVKFELWTSKLIGHGIISRRIVW